MKHFNTHHIVPKSRGGTNFAHNLLQIKIQKHNAIHEIFGNEMPHEQMISLLEIYSQALVLKVKNDISDVIKCSSNYIYKDGLWRR